MQRLIRKVIKDNRLARALSRKSDFPPKLNYQRASDGTKIYDYHELSVYDVLQDYSSHPRIPKYWEKHRHLDKFLYFPLELRAFLTRPHRIYQFNKKDKAWPTTPFPKVTTKEELKAFLLPWFPVLNSWLFGRTFSSTSLDILDPVAFKGKENLTLYGIYIHQTNTIQIYAHTELPVKNFRGSVQEFHLNTLFHEIVHAFIYQHSYQKEFCKPLSRAELGGCGSSSYGPLWADCMTDLSDILRKTVNWTVDVGIADCVQEAMCLDGFQLNKKQLEYWGLDPKMWGNIEYCNVERSKVLTCHERAKKGK